MALYFPASIIPNSVSEPTPIRGRFVNQSPYSMGSQERTTASCLYEVSFTFPPLTLAQMDLVRSIKDQGGEILMPLHRPFLAPVTSGTILVGTGASLASLPVTGVDTGFAPKAGRFLSIFIGGGRPYLYSLKDDSPAGSTSRTFNLTHPIRTSHSVGQPVYMEPPYIQGLAEWTMPTIGIQSGMYEGLQITIRESR